MNWLKAHWRKVVLVVLGAAAALAGEHTVYNKIYPVVNTVVNSIPCTPGEDNPNCPPVNKAP